VNPGDHVTVGDLMASVQVEKVEQEVYAPVEGEVLELLVPPGEVAEQETPIARIGAPGEASAVGASAPPVPASPAAKRVAKELDVDLASVRGTGPGGRIVEDDVRGAAPSAGPGEPLPGPRRLMAQRMHDWLGTTAQITLTSEVDVTDLAASDPSWAAALVRACALALVRHPLLSRRWDEDRLVMAGSIDLGVAVALDDGLVVPVVREADTKDLATLATEISDLAHRARAGGLAVHDVSGAVFTVTSLGMYPIDAFTPLLQPPQTAILGAGRATARPAVVGGRIEVRTLQVLSLTVDHRVIDGAPAAAFLAEVGALLADPTRERSLKGQVRRR
jgi:pyruvate dehydrogenase E2 component (dihydrolipoamide acetyltransferase)